MNHEENADISLSSDYRQISINEFQPNDFCPNYVSRTKYTIFTFLPLFLYDQFHNYTNCFFLLVSIIQQFPEAATLGRFTTIIPLSIILTISAIKEILEDYRRYKADTVVNTKTVETFRDLHWSRIKWKDVRVGDFIRVYMDEYFPADTLFLTGQSQSGDNEVCYIETVNLDGENSFKMRHTVPNVQVKQVTNVRAIILCDKPNENIYSFKGIFIDKNDDVKIALTANNLLLRGSMLRNTNWIIGVVVYTGHDTKIMKNMSSTRLKRSSVSAIVNSHVLFLFSVFLMLTLVHWALSLIWNDAIYSTYISYLPLERYQVFDDSTYILCLIFSVIYSIVIPISLPVMQEVSRFIQAVYISNDLDMYDEITDTPTQVKTSSLNEDLALVKYIFSDKTGTLTKNILEFKYCSVGGEIYDMAALKTISNTLDDVNNPIRNLFIAITLCPGVVPVHTKQNVAYFASSPDQKTLVTAARDIGVTLTRRTHDKVNLLICDKTEIFKIEGDFEFTSERKRSSVVVKNSQNEIILYIIGADQVIIPYANQNEEEIEQVRHHVEVFSSRGLRSICIAMAKMDESQFNEWYPMYKRANETFNQKEILLAQAEAFIVKNLTLLGCTAIEDKLQDDVPETIETLLQAGINMWMLTGDKQETAINIGLACRLLSVDTPLIILNANDLHQLREIVGYHKEMLGERFGRPGNNFALIINGSSLQILFDSGADVDACILLMLSCRAVICCRISPKQKAMIVKNVRKRTRHVTLAIGDGANDVAMIQTACIGVGISGEEGLQAANAADYSIAKFKYLKKLLLVHGTWCYNRLCKMIFFIYYKNVAIALIQFFYVSTNLWSGFLFFDRWAKMLYNVLLTSLPTLSLGVFEKHLPESILLKMPREYLSNNWFNFRAFFLCLLNAVFHAAALLCISLMVFRNNVDWSSGLNDNYAIIGHMVYTGLLVVVSLKPALHTCHWTNLTFICLVVSMGFWPVVLLILSHTWPYLSIGEDMSFVFEIIGCTPLFWLYLLFIVITILTIDLVVIILYRSYKKPFVNIAKYMSDTIHLLRRDS